MKKPALDIKVEGNAVVVRMNGELREAYLETGPVQGEVTDDGAFAFMAVDCPRGHLAMRVLEWVLDWCKKNGCVSGR